MAVPSRVAGIAYFQRDGVAYPLRGAFKVQPLDTMKEGIAGQDGVHGFKETPIVPYIEGEITDSGVSLKTLQSVRDSTVRAELANGKTYILTGAWYAGPAELDAVEGKLTAKFEGLRCMEVMPS